MYAATQPALDHYSFFKALAGSSGPSHARAELEAGLVTLRLVDRWAREGMQVLRDRASEVRSVEGAIDAVSAGSTHRRVLRGVLDVLTDRHDPVSPSGLSVRLTAYARALQLDGRWDLAADVYRTIASYLPIAEDADLAADTYMQLGGCLRTLGLLDEALDAYRAAGWIAAEQNMPAVGVRANIGEANVALQRGNLPAAEAMLDRAIEEAATRQDASAVLPIALHDRAHVAYRRGQSERAAVLVYDAIRRYTDPTKRDRALVDLATFLADVGYRDAARDAHLVVAATTQEQYLRWVATINLLEASVLDNQEHAFAMYRSELEREPLPPELAAYYHLYTARGHRMFAQEDLADAAFDRATEIATAHGINEVLALVEAQRDIRAAPRSGDPTVIDAPTIAHVVSGLRELRAAMVAAR